MTIILFANISLADDSLPVSLSWQPGHIFAWKGDLWDQARETHIRFRATHRPSKSGNIISGYSGKVHIIANPFQRFTVCSHSVITEDAAMIATENAL